MAYCRKCGSEVDPKDSFCRKCGERILAPEATPLQTNPPPAENDKDRLLGLVEQTLVKFPQLAVKRSEKTDLEINSVLADTKWALGKKKVEYSACLTADENTRTVLFWEMIKESSAGIPIFGFFKAETTKTDTSTISGKVHEVGYGPGGKVIDYNWDYGKTRKIIEEIVKAHGWQFKTTLNRGKVMRK